MRRKYAQLRVDERCRIERWRAAKVSPTEMARVLGRHRSTIFRELKRNHFQNHDFPKVAGYFAMAAHRQTAKSQSASSPSLVNTI
ncbi:helix-turn-helix domain-containing protein [uncultured Jannaschia sp.]|uniref:helix-turn-helix domain-containing protein n=1 Tax=uncultured Jannaschia sp. TaxID=293347 RepID=UPI002617A40D|nr:helix-turn-helix domain-containing protein [uncultured Jannaschia sp.]